MHLPRLHGTISGLGQVRTIGIMLAYAHAIRVTLLHFIHLSSGSANAQVSVNFICTY